jgi:hypothetical protein
VQDRGKKPRPKGEYHKTIIIGVHLALCLLETACYVSYTTRATKLRPVGDMKKFSRSTSFSPQHDLAVVAADHDALAHQHASSSSYIAPLMYSI